VRLGVKCRCTIFYARDRFQRKRAETRYAKFVFLHLVGSADHILHSGASQARTIDALFFVLEWGQYGFDKKNAGTSYAKLVFLHPVGSAGHVVHSGASGARNIDALFSMVRWAR
jgi:hypothetical protein